MCKFLTATHYTAFVQLWKVKTLATHATTNKNYWGWGKEIQGVKEIHWQDDKSFSCKTEVDQPEREECQGQEIKMGCEPSYYCDHNYITMCGWRMSVGLIVVMQKREKGKLQGILLAEPIKYLIRGMLIVNTMLHV